MAKKQEAKPSVFGKLITVILVLGILGFVSLMMVSLVAIVFMEDISESGNIALITLTGPITVEGGNGAFGGDGVSSTEIIKLLKKVEEKSEVRGVILEINSPGGSAVASAEIAHAVANLNKTTVAVIREVGASGAYWIASSADIVFAHELSMTGSIGVIGSYIEFAGFMDRYNLTYQRLVAGKYKDTGTPFRELQQEERELFQEKLDAMHDVFIREVAQHRGLTEAHIRDLATGFVYLGSEAKAEGLIDEFGGREEAIRYIEQLHGIKGEVGEYKPKRTLGDLLSELYFDKGYAVGRGIGDSMLSQNGIRT